LFQLALALGGVLVGAGLVSLALTATDVDQAGYRAALACWVTVPYILAGLIAWRRRPESRLGVLMVIAGFGSFVNFLVWSDNHALFTLGLAGQALPPVLFLHVFLAFPSGRLPNRATKAVVGAAYGAAALTLPALALGEGGPANVLTLTRQPVAAEWLHLLQLGALGVLLLAGVGSLLHQRRTSRPVRSATGVLVDSFALALLMTAILMLAGLFGWCIADPVRIGTFLAVGAASIVFLVGLLQARLDRASVADVLLQIGANPGPVELQSAVARALYDPSARLAYWLPEFECYVDTTGAQLDLTLEPGQAIAPVVRNGHPVAVLIHDAGVDEDLVSSVVAATGLMIENAQLQVELRARLEELRGSRARILAAEERGRRNLERDLHDGAQQRLVALGLELGLLDEELSNQPSLRGRLDAVKSEVAASLAELRDVAHGIYPAAVRDHGLSVALDSLTTRAPLPVQLIGATPDRYPEPVELTAFYLVSESLTNVAKHAHATHALVELTHDAGNLVVEITDDGIGGATTERGTGLRGLADRVEAHGGRLRVWSPSGNGTRVKAEIPCAR
jgi:signal transduction histidine kinase